MSPRVKTSQPFWAICYNVYSVGKNEIFTYVSVGFPAFWFVSIAFYLSLGTTDEALTQTSLFSSPLIRYLHKLIRPPKPSLLQVEESQLSLLPIEQMLHSPIFFLDFFVQLTPAHPYLSCTEKPRDVALSVLSREEGPPFQLLATFLMQLRRLRASLASRTPHCLVFNLVSTNMHRCLSTQLLCSWSALSPSCCWGFTSSCEGLCISLSELHEAHVGLVLTPVQVLLNGSTAFWCPDHSSKLAETELCLITHIVNADVEQHWPHYQHLQGTSEETGLQLYFVLPITITWFW